MNNRPLVPIYIKIILIVLALGIAILTLLPFGVRMVFASQGIDGRMVLHPEYYSYYDKMPLGYGRWSVMFVFVFSILEALSTILFFFKKKERTGLLIYIIIDIAVAILQVTDILFYFSVTWVNFVLLGIAVIAGGLAIYSNIKIDRTSLQQR